MKLKHVAFAAALLLVLQSSFVVFAKETKPRPEAEIFLSEVESAEMTEKLPMGIRILLEDEVQKNLFFLDPENSKEYEKLGLFHPSSQRWFYVPHFEIPLKDIETMNIARNLTPEMKKLYFFKRDGVEYLRYFLHPFREMQNYEAQMKKYGLNYEYIARPTSSPRSLIVVKKGSSNIVPYWVKVSLHAKLTDLQRRQKLEKLARALAVNVSFESIPESIKNKYHFDFMPEPIAVKLPGKEEVIIGRGIVDQLRIESGYPRLRATHALFFGTETVEPEVTLMIKKSGLSEMEFFVEYMIKPAIRSFAYLGFQEGIQPGLHSANYSTLVGRNGLPTGDIVIRDLDGAWFDVETRMLKGKSMEDIHKFMTKPFSQFLFPSASGRGSSERQHFGEIYNRYIRNASGFSSLGSLIYNYMLGKHPRKNAELLKEEIQETFDRVMIAEVEKHTGIKLKLEDMKGGHLKVNGINRVLNQERQRMLDETVREDAVMENQEALKKEFFRLRQIDRVWLSQSLKDDALESRLAQDHIVAFFDREAGMIQLRSYRGQDSGNYSIFGYALLEDMESAQTQKFLKKLKADPKAEKHRVKRCATKLEVAYLFLVPAFEDHSEVA